MVGRAGGDLAVLNELLYLEHLQEDFYRWARDAGLLNAAIPDFAERVRWDEEQHARALEEAVGRLGGEPPGRPRFRFPLEDEGAALGLAARLEDLAAAAYLGQAARVGDREILALVASIHGVEARHAAAIHMLRQESITKGGAAFDEPVTAEEFREATREFVEP